MRWSTPSTTSDATTVSHHKADSDGSVFFEWISSIGFDNELNFVFVDTSGDPFDIEDYRFSIQFRKEGSSENVLNLAQGSAAVTNNGALGTLNALVGVANSNLFKHGARYVGQVSVIHPDGKKKRWYNFLYLPSREIHTNSINNVSDTISVDGTTITTTITIPGTADHYRGLYATLVALQTAIPTGLPGDFADVDAGIGTDIQRYLWDDSDDEWILGGGSGDAANISFTPAQGIAATNVQAAIEEVVTDLTTIANAKVADAINDGTTTVAPSQNAVFDALALKADASAVMTALALKAPLAGSKVIQLACSDEITALTAGTGKITFRMPYAMTVSAVRASLGTAQTSGSILTVDINESGTTILSTKLTIDNTESTSTTAATAAVISDTALADAAEITIDIDQLGDGTAKGLKVSIIGS